MAERVVSPGVFTRERDLSFLEQGVANIGAAFVGVAQKGPAFVPVIVDSQTEFEERFGKADEYSYLGYTVQNYLQEAQSATVVRVLGLGGYQPTLAKTAALVIGDGSSTRVLAVFHPTVSGSTFTAASVTLGSGAAKYTDMTIVLTTADVTTTWTGVNASGSSANSIANSIGTNPYSTKAGYVYSYFPDATDGLNGGLADASAVTMVTVPSSTQLDFAGIDYSNASTPWIRSQALGGTRTNLFKVHTLADGSNANKAVKISIQSVKYQTRAGSFGTFSLLVRRHGDTDKNPEVLEQYDNLNLDSNSSDFIARRVGNSAPYTDAITAETYYQGDYPNHSRYIRIELSEDALNSTLSELSLPYGFAAVRSPYATGFYEGPGLAVLPRVIQTVWSDGTALGTSTSRVGWAATRQRDAKLFYGYDYTATNHTNQSYLAPLQLDIQL